MGRNPDAMQNIIFHLANCNTCKRILNDLEPLKEVTLQEIKTKPVSSRQLDQLKELAGSYEALFSRRAVLYRSRNLAEKELTEDDYRLLMLEHYTFLKRPIMVIDGMIFVGNAAKTVAAAREALHG